MEKYFWQRPELNISRPKTYLYAAVWTSAGLVGVAAVMYARLISAVQGGAAGVAAGMVAFFSGAIGAPLTAVIIVTEMSDQHILAIPFMIAAYLAFSLGKRIMPVPLYHCLAKRHLEVQLDKSPPTTL